MLWRRLASEAHPPLDLLVLEYYGDGEKVRADVSDKLLHEKAEVQALQAVQQMINSLEKNHITPQRKRGFLCAAQCCDKGLTADQLQQCIQSCEEPGRQTAQLVDASLKDFQARLQRCAVRCQDEAQESLGPSASDADVKAAQGKFEACTLKCLVEYEKKLPKLQKDIEIQLENLSH